MALKKFHILVCFAFFFTMAVSLVVFSVPAVAAPAEEPAAETDAADISVDEPEIAVVNSKYYEGNGNKLDLSKLQKGDVISVRGIKKLSGLIPGYYCHSAIYIGNGKIVEAMPEGVRISYAKIIHGADTAAIHRIRTTSSKKGTMVSFVKSKVGYKYDWALWKKQVYGSRYYCSELAWAGMKHAGGPDIDRNPGWSWTYLNAVAPQEIADDRDTYQITKSS